jgi:hypothetical protein
LKSAAFDKRRRNRIYLQRRVARASVAVLILGIFALPIIGRVYSIADRKCIKRKLSERGMIEVISTYKDER